MVRAPGSAHASIAGGFVLVPVAELMTCWHACRARPLGVGDFRAYLACREMVTRRRGHQEGRGASYGPAELAGLLGVTPRRARASLGRLGASGLLDWSEADIAFPSPGPRDPGLADSIGGGRGSVAIPRRLLRFLARGAGPALIATALGLLLRCLSRRRTGWDGRGRVKAAWVAAAFGVSDRRVKEARAELIAIGWIAPEAADQWSLNKWGRAYRIDLAWSPPGARSSPPAPGAGARSSPPDANPDPLRGENNQEPTPGGPAGAWPGRSGREQGEPPATPRLDDVRVEDLKATERTLELHRQAVARGWVAPGEAGRLNVVAAAEHALAVGKVNPPGLFRHLVSGRLWRYLSAEDEDRAAARIKRHLWGGPATKAPSMTSPFAPAGAGLTADARLVREVRAAAIRAGHLRDPFPLVATRDASWTRGRWDRALEELGAL